MNHRYNNSNPRNLKNGINIDVHFFSHPFLFTSTSYTLFFTPRHLLKKIISSIPEHARSLISTETDAVHTLPISLTDGTDAAPYHCLQFGWLISGECAGDFPRCRLSTRKRRNAVHTWFVPGAWTGVTQRSSDSVN